MSSRYDIVLNSIDHIIERDLKSGSLNYLNNLNIFRNFINRIINLIDVGKIDTYQPSNNEKYVRTICDTYIILRSSLLYSDVLILIAELICSTTLIREIDKKLLPSSEMKISDVIFSNIIYYSDIPLRILVEEQNAEVIASYKRFDILATKYSRKNTKPDDIKYFAQFVIPKYRDYFIRSLQEYPDKWADKNFELWYNLGKKEHKLMLEYLIYNPTVIKYAARCVCLQFVPFLIHRKYLYLATDKKNIRRCSDILYCKFDNIHMEFINISELLGMLIKKQRMVKQAKNYLPRSFDNDKQYPLVKLWKLNFMRMFEYSKNLNMIHNAAHSQN